MKRGIICLPVMVLVIIFSFSTFLPTAVSGTQDSVSAHLLDVSSVAPDNGAVLETRFLNMLNHSYVYNDDFDSVETVVNNSIISLLALRDGDFIAEGCVTDFVFNMYGVEITDTSLINTAYPSRDGYFYIIPRGYTEYKHTIKSVVLNEDGSYTVVTQATDSFNNTITVTSLFVKNDRSEFGYTIIYSDINDSAAFI